LLTTIENFTITTNRNMYIQIVMLTKWTQ